jgi:hypothetical protein
LDYPSKTGGIRKVVYPTGDIDTDMREIMDFFSDKTGLYPQNFSVDQRYAPGQPK